ncbi:MAG: hypothetical protein AB7G39_17240 [Alphaproteobacteria bacterium]
MNPNARAQDLIEVTESFSEVLEQENTLLKTHRIGDIAPLQANKTSLARLYEARMLEAHAVRDSFKEVEPALRSRLLEAGERFEDAMRDNVTALRAAMELNQRLLKTIARAVREQQPVAHGYTATGRDPRAAPVPLGHVPMTLNKEF